MSVIGQMFYKRRSNGELVPINLGPRGPQGEQGLQGIQGEPGPPVAEGGITQVDADERYLQTAGDTMVGDLILTNPPTQDSHAASKEYVDTTFENGLPVINMPSTYDEQVTEAGDPTDDPSLVTAVHALPYPAGTDGLRVARALEMLAEALDLVVPIVLHGTDAPPEPATDFPEGTIYLRTET